MSDVGGKVNLYIWNLFIVSVVLGENYRVRIMALASTVLNNQLFQTAFRCKFDLEL